MKKSEDHPAWHMRRALRLAEQAKGWTKPNPMVGAILIKAGKRIGEGYHTRYGAAHAEIEALKNAQESARGATLYVTLEPCCHQGKTPPCTEAVIKSGIKKVVIATKDPSQKVNGQGIKALQEAGIEVEVGLLENEARELNRFFFTYHEKGRPYITLKAALSLDGKIAVAPGQRTVLTAMPAQRYLHSLRHEHEAILVGAGTVLTDNPHLGVRHIEGQDPLRIVLTGARKLPKDLQIFRDENVLLLPDKNIKEVLNVLYEKGISSVLIEGGQKVFEAFIKAKVVDEMILFLAPTFLGKKAVAFAELPQPIKLSQVHAKTLGKDLVLHAVPEF
jgi:diaminohydroxyphosphoribosylaminopyrimidine deaminase/5-amino-6-(5-phosphoribosylamino)uracil reductase